MTHISNMSCLNNIPLDVHRLGWNFLPYWTMFEATSLGLVRRLIAVAVRSVVVIVLVCGISFLAFFTAFAQAPLHRFGCALRLFYCWALVYFYAM